MTEKIEIIKVTVGDEVVYRPCITYKYFFGLFKKCMSIIRREAGDFYSRDFLMTFSSIPSTDHATHAAALVTAHEFLAWEKAQAIRKEVKYEVIEVIDIA